MDRQEVIDQLKEILREMPIIDDQMLDSLTEESDFVNDLGVPSAEFINIIVDVEDTFEVEFEDSDIEDMGNSVGEMIDLVIKTKTANAS